MGDKKNIWITQENYEYLDKLAFINKSSKESELNRILEKMRKEEQINIYITKTK